MRIKAVNLFYLFLGLFGFKSTNAVADIFMCSPELSGDVTAPRYTDCIDVTSWQWGMGRSVIRQPGVPVDASDVSVSEVTISKVMDSSSVDLANLAVAGTAIKALDLFVEECPICAEGNPRVELHLTDVLISGFSQSSGGDLPTESISLNFGTVQWCYRNDALKQPLECGSYDFSAPPP